MKTPKTLLIVDDEESILKSLKRELADTDMTVLLARGGEEALQVVAQGHVQVVLSDNRMPGMSGIELFQKIKKISPGTVRVMMTGYADLSAALEAINTGEVYRFFVKPWDNDELLQILTDAMAHSLSDKPVI